MPTEERGISREFSSQPLGAHTSLDESRAGGAEDTTALPSAPLRQCQDCRIAAARGATADGARAAKRGDPPAD